MWYYQIGNQTVGPIGAGEIAVLIRDNRITPGTLVWRQGMAGWQPAAQTEWANFFQQQIFPPAPPQSSVYQAPVQYVSSADDVERLHEWWRMMWICVAAMVGSGLFAMVVASAIPLLGVLACLILIGSAVGSVVFHCLMLHKLWSLIPVQVAETTPAKAVGFIFIPFFSLYWIFVAFYGLAKALNAETRRNSIANATVNENMSLTACILYCGSFVPILGILCGIAACIIWYITLAEMRDAGIALLHRRG